MREEGREDVEMSFRMRGKRRKGSHTSELGIKRGESFTLLCMWEIREGEGEERRGEGRETSLVTPTFSKGGRGEKQERAHWFGWESGLRGLLCGERVECDYVCRKVKCKSKESRTFGS